MILQLPLGLPTGVAGGDALNSEANPPPAALLAEWEATSQLEHNAKGSRLGPCSATRNCARSPNAGALAAPKVPNPCSHEGTSKPLVSYLMSKLPSFAEKLSASQRKAPIYLLQL